MMMVMMMMMAESKRNQHCSVGCLTFPTYLW